MITTRLVEDDRDIDTYLQVRNRVHPDRPMPREAIDDARQKSGHIDVIAELDGEPVGVASVERFGGDPDSDLASMTIRVPRENRRRGIGTALDRRCSEHARRLGKARLWVALRGEDADSLAYYTHRGFEEVGRMREVWLDLEQAAVTPVVPDGIRMSTLTPEHERGAYEVALEAEPDIPSGADLVPGSFERWRERSLGPLVMPELSFVALDGERVVGYALLGRFDAETADHWMTGVARSARGRGIALAMKQQQIAAAKDAGWRFLRTQNDLANAPMRRVNEQLGYEPRIEWVQLTGALL
jgi:GNAT superfamily N-acetyltransferase